MVHCRPRGGCCALWVQKVRQAQVLSCTDCSRARVGVYHRTWAGGTVVRLLLPADPGSRLDLHSERAPGLPEPSGLQKHVCQPTAPGSSSPGWPRHSLPLPAESQSTPTPKQSPSILQIDPELWPHTDSGQPSWRVRTRRNFFSLALARSPSWAAQWWHQVPRALRAEL